MTDIAELDIRADSRDLERAKAALDGLAASAAKTEQATAGIRRGLDEASQGATRARNALGQFTAAGDQSARTFNNNATAAAGFQRSVGSAAASVEQSIEWQGITADGVELDFTDEAVAAVYRRFQWIREQVTKAIHDPKGFPATRSTWAPPAAVPKPPRQPDFSKW